MTNSWVRGIQGQTFVCSNLDRTTRFLTEVLGLRLVKRTVHHLDPRQRVAAFDFGPESNSIVTYIEWNPIFYALPSGGLLDPDSAGRGYDSPEVGDAKGQWGAGTNHHLAFHTQSREQLLRWKRYLSDLGHHVTGPYFRNYFNAIYLRDPDGAILEIATTEPGFGHDEEELGSSHRDAPEGTMAGDREELQIADEIAPGPVAVVDEEMALRGFHHNTSVSSDIEKTTAFFCEEVGIELIKRTDYLDQDNATHYYYAASQQPEVGAVLTFFGFPGFGKGRLGVGLSHHISLLAADDDALEAWRDSLVAADVEVGPIEDLRYYRAATFRDPDGHLFQLATAADFTVDEDQDTLGARLCLPEELEPRRSELESFHRLRPAPQP